MIHHGDLFDVLPTLDAESIDACCTDPPYELSFMSKHWDRSGVAFRVETWCEVYRVLKPGAYLLAFGGTRTFHRMTCAIEDAGFEIRDCLSWLYGSGFPKSLDVSKAIDKAAGAEREMVGVKTTPDGKPYTDRRPVNKDRAGWDRPWKNDPVAWAAQQRVTAPATDAAKQWQGWGTALKPSWEPIILARKPFEGTVSANVLQHGTGALNIDACRIGAGETIAGGGGTRAEDNRWRDKGGMNTGGREYRIKPHDLGRWPANVILDDHAAALLDAQSGELTSAIGKPHTQGSESATVSFNGKAVSIPGVNQFGDSGGASRFFYVAKPSREERDYGCHFLALKTPGEMTDRQDGSAGLNNPRAGAGRTGGGRNLHPTVKPVELMRWLVRLVTPPNGVCLDPFTGSGTTGMACRYEQRQFIGIEREAEYVRIAEARIAAVAPLFNDEPEVKRVDPQASLWGEAETDGAA